jgi:acyl dehydratase
MNNSKTLDELNIGDSESITVTLTEEHVESFAKATGDYNPLHMDSSYAEKTLFGKRVVHGVLLTGIVSGLLGTKFPGLGTVARELTSKFSKPVFIGDTVTATAHVVEKNDKLNMCTLKYEVKTPQGKTAVKGKAVVLPKR